MWPFLSDFQFADDMAVDVDEPLSRDNEGSVLKADVQEMEALELERDAGVGPSVKPLTPVSIFSSMSSSSILPGTFSPSLIQDDEVSSTIEQELANNATGFAGAAIDSIDADDFPNPLLPQWEDGGTADELIQFPSTSQPSPPEDGHGVEEEPQFTELVSVPFPGILNETDAGTVQPNLSSQDIGAHSSKELSPEVGNQGEHPNPNENVASEAADNEINPEGGTSISVNEDGTETSCPTPPPTDPLPKTTLPASEVVQLPPDLHNSTWPFTHCKLVLTKCDDSQWNEQDKEGNWTHNGNTYIFRDRISQSEIEELKSKSKVIDTQEKSSGNIAEVIVNQKKINAQLNGKTRRRRRKRYDASSIRYSRYRRALRYEKLGYKTSKLNKKPTASLKDQPNEIRAGDSASVSSPEDVEAELDKIKMEGSPCPSPNISDADSIYEDEVGKKDDNNHRIESPFVNIIQEEEAKAFVKAWVDCDGDTGAGSKTDKPSPTQDNAINQAEMDTSGEIDDPEDKDKKPSLKCSTCSKSFDNPMTLQVHVSLRLIDLIYFAL